MPLPEEELELLRGIRDALEDITGWPLDRSETFGAFALMGLTSRLQPVQVNDMNAQKIVVALAKKLGEDMAAATEKK